MTPTIIYAATEPCASCGSVACAMNQAGQVERTGRTDGCRHGSNASRVLADRVQVRYHEVEPCPNCGSRVCTLNQVGDPGVGCRHGDSNAITSAMADQLIECDEVDLDPISDVDTSPVDVGLSILEPPPVVPAKPTRKRS